jgi:FkbM family methyltransferase
MKLLRGLLKDVSDCKEDVIDILKQNPAPVMIYGAAYTAVRVAKHLQKNDIEITAFFVDEQYYKPNIKIMDIPVLSINDVFEKYAKFNTVIGFYEYNKAKNIISSDKFASKGKVLYWNQAESFGWDFIDLHHQEFEDAFGLFKDQQSKDIFIAYMKSRLTGYPDELIEFCSKPQYFCDFVHLTDKEVLVDCGAYDGDTLIKFNEITHSEYEKIYAFEPDPENYLKLKEMAEQLHDVTLINKGLWKESTILYFNSQGDASKISEDGDLTVNVISIDEVVGANKVTMIKMDIEGSELCALHGAQNTIRRWLPKLAICMYHRKEDMITIPQYIQSILGKDQKYNFYLRHHSYSYCETVLYAIPDTHSIGLDC